MKIHEYQATELFQKAGVAVVSGHVATDAQEAARIAEKIGYPVVLKAQVLVGGRGKAGGIKRSILRRNWQRRSRNSGRLRSRIIRWKRSWSSGPLTSSGNFISE